MWYRPLQKQLGNFLYIVITKYKEHVRECHYCYKLRIILSNMNLIIQKQMNVKHSICFASNTNDA